MARNCQSALTLSKANTSVEGLRPEGYNRQAGIQYERCEAKISIQANLIGGAENGNLLTKKALVPVVAVCLAAIGRDQLRAARGS
jgi:hypothetical protein